MTTHPWDDDKVQFARLLDEISAAGLDDGTLEALCESMYLPAAKIREVLARATASWDEAKACRNAGLPPVDAAYCWKEYVQVEGFEAEGRRLITPHGDPMEYENPADLLFDTPEKAVEWLEGMASADSEITPAEARTWVLCKRTLEPMRLPRPLEITDEEEGNDAT